MTALKSSISLTSPTFKANAVAMAVMLIALLASVTVPAYGGETAAPDCSYPAAERKAGIEGTVILRITVGVDGSVKDAQIAQSSGNEELDRVAAICAKAHWRYRPAKKNGVPVEAQILASVVWKLNP